MSGAVCSVEGCERDASTSARGRRGYCASHYHRWVVHGDPLAGRELNGESFRWLSEEALKIDSDECILWPFRTTTRGYGSFLIGQKRHAAHRWICEKAHGAPPSKTHQAAHSCGVRLCVNRAHLRWATVSENHADKLQHGTHGRGEQNSRAKLSNNEVHEILDLLQNGESRAAVAERFPVSVSCVAQIDRGERWSWVREAKP